jgi:hypothetical protein
MEEAIGDHDLVASKVDCGDNASALRWWLIDDFKVIRVVVVIVVIYWPLAFHFSLDSSTAGSRRR